MSDYTTPADELTLGMVPSWTFPYALAKFNPQTPSGYALYCALEKLDRCDNTPFGFYFFMSDGNRVADVGDRVIQLAEQGKIVLP